MTPLQLFREWIADIDPPVAMALATASADGAPSVRMVLLKEADDVGVVFFTNYESRKGRELRENPRAALLVHSPGRQIRIEGDVERLSAGESDAYWETRPHASRRSAVASRQSEVVASREELERRAAEVRGRPAATRFLGRLPPHAAHVGVLGAPRRPSARPHAVPPRRRRLGQRALFP